MEKFRWINESIEIDFSLPKSTQLLIKKLEELDIAEDYSYFNWAEALDFEAKELVVLGKLSTKQWDLLCEKYDGR